MIVLRTISSDPRKAAVFAREVVIETAWVVVPVAVVVLFGRGTPLASLAIAVGGFALALILGFGFALVTFEYNAWHRYRTLDALKAMSTEEFLAEMKKGFTYHGRRQRPD